MNKKGFTLIEFLVYLSVLGVLFLSLFSFLVWIFRFNEKMKITEDSLYYGNRIMSIMNYNLREAQGIDLSASNFNTDAGNIVFINRDGERSEFLICDNDFCFDQEGSEKIMTPGDFVVERLRFEIIEGGDSALIYINLAIRDIFEITKPVKLETFSYPRVFYEN